MENDRKPKPENHVTLTIITVDGNYTDDYNKHNTLQKVVDKAVDKLDLLYDLSQYKLYKGTNVLELTLSIEQAGLVDGDELELRKENVGGGRG